MNCSLHPDLPATAYCRSCGKPLCDACHRLAHGTIYCQEHVPVPVVDSQNPYAQPAASAAVKPDVPGHASPVLAFVLGFIPGVGAIYNGQYLKGLVHAIIFGLIASILGSVDHSAGGPAIGFVMVAFLFYMPFEAYHTAKRRMLGRPVEEFSSILSPGLFYSRAPIGPVLLILVGVLFLLDTLHLIEFRDIVRFWPVILILAGAFMLYNRVGHGEASSLDPRAEYGETRQ